MTMAERNNKLKHLITCLKCEVRGKSCDVNCPTQYDAGNMGEIIENLEVISKALEQEPSGDLISREELLKAIDTWDKFGVDDTNSLFRLDNLSLPHYVPYIHYDDAIKCIKGMTSVNSQEPKTGHWIITYPFGTSDPIYECPYCKASNNSVFKNFCPNCGCRMVEPQESEGI